MAAGDVLFADGDETYDLIVILDGEVQIIEHRGQPGENVLAAMARRSSSARSVCSPASALT